MASRLQETYFGEEKNSKMTILGLDDHWAWPKGPSWN